MHRDSRGGGDVSEWLLFNVSRGIRNNGFKEGDLYGREQGLYASAYAKSTAKCPG